MQTFLPYADFQQTAQVLDRARLGKQRLEALQILEGQWVNHPASKMWRGYEHVLAIYGQIICQEWRQRGYQDTLLPQFVYLQEQATYVGYPWWYGNEDFHFRHRLNLMCKYPLHYRQFWPDLQGREGYLWPNNETQTFTDI